MRYFLLTGFSFSVLFLIVFSNKSIVREDDYSSYLENISNKEYTDLLAEKDFWAAKLESSAGQHPTVLKLAEIQNQLFKHKGHVEFLLESSKNLEKANKMSGYKSSNIHRLLARNYISQHRFDEALIVLNKSKELGQGEEATNKMLFDVHLELGNIILAEEYLKSISKINDFDYLIRVSKWEDHLGNLDQAIVHMEQALQKAISTNNTTLLEWTYTNLADFYGHANRISDSYDYYLKALELNSNNFYALKGIAWISFSHDRNSSKSLEIIQQISKVNDSPDYDLFKYELAEYNGSFKLAERHLRKYISEIISPKYGNMYNKYLVDFYTDQVVNSKKALSIARIEIALRPTPQSYSLLAKTRLAMDDKEQALNIMVDHVINKSSEPEILLNLAKIYKANKLDAEALIIKEELLTAIYELGPNVENKIMDL